MFIIKKMFSSMNDIDFIKNNEKLSYDIICNI